MIELRPAGEGDLPAITAIYNYAIANTVATFDLEEKSEEEMRAWLAGHGELYPAIVCVDGGRVVGFASLNEYSPKKAYGSTAVVSVYVDPGDQGQGYGRTLLGGIIQDGAKAGIHAMIARITEGNEISVHLFRSFDFVHIGRLREVGRKFGRLLDVELYEKIIENNREG
jgi:phosphinothricin acetyltransferase